MEKIQSLILQHSIASFLISTLFISLLSFGVMCVFPQAQSPDSKEGLPVWLIAIWSPNISAIILWFLKKNLVAEFQVIFAVPKFSAWSFIVLIPFFVMIVLFGVQLVKGVDIGWSNFKIGYVLPLVLINLIMGPLGEEVGWRGFLYPELKDRDGWFAGALVVGVIWAVWHWPLWLIDSPQSKIPFWAFAANVVCLSILMSITYNHSHGSILTSIALHLVFNVCLGVVDIIGSYNSGEYVTKSLFVYVPITLVLVGIHEWYSNQPCAIEGN